MSKRETWNIREMSWTEFEERRQGTKLAIIPTGAVEVYGPHLPMGTDGLVAEGVSDLLARRTGGLVAPMMDLSDSTALMSFPGTFTISRELLQAWIEALMENLYRYGFRDFVFITGHAGSVDVINSVARRWQMEKDELRFVQVDWWRFVGINAETIMQERGRMANGHASEAGTSVMMHLYPDLVDFSKATCQVPPDAANFTDLHHFAPLSSRTPNGIVGNALAGTPEKGEKIVEACLARVLSFLREQWKMEIA